MKPFNLRKSHDRTRGMDVFLISLVLFGAWAAWFGFPRGGAWSVLAVMALAGEALLGYGCLFELQRLVVTRYREALISDPKTWIRIVYISDLHAGAFHPKSWYERIVRESSALNPDLVILGGDYVVDRVEPMDDLAPLKDLRGRLGSYFVLGNHDYMDRPQEIRSKLQAFGFEDLTARTIRIESEGRALELHGVDDIWFGAPRIFQRTSASVPHLTVSHEPDIALDLQEHSTDLILAGHTHGGQVRLPLIGALWPIPSKFGRKADRGRKILNGITCLISDGAGETDGRMRMFAPPEIMVVEVGV